MDHFRLSGVILLVAGSLAGCQSTTAPQKMSSENNHLAQDTNKTLQQYEKAKVEYENWLDKMKEVDTLRLYHPEGVNDLLDTWADTQDVYDDFVSKPLKANEKYSLFSSGTYLEVYQARIDLLSLQYNKLLKLKEVSDDLLSSAMLEMDTLQKINAVDVFPAHFNKLKRQFHGLFGYVAENELEEAKTHQTHFLTEAKKLEVKMAIQRDLKPLETKLALLRKESFNKLAPISYAKVLASIEQMEGVINEDPRNTEAIALETNEVTFSLERLKQIGLEVKRYKETDQDKFELLVLGHEKLLHQIAQAIEPQDLRDATITAQEEKIVQSIEQLNPEKAPLQISQVEE